MVHANLLFLISNIFSKYIELRKTISFITKPRCICVWNLVKICQSICELCVTFHPGLRVIFHLDIPAHKHTQTNHQTNILAKIQICDSTCKWLTHLCKKLLVWSNTILFQLNLWHRQLIFMDSGYSLMTVTSYKNHDMYYHQQQNCLFRLKTKTTSKLHITGPLWEKSTCYK